MKQMLKKAIIPAIALSLVFIIPARAVEPPAASTGVQQQALPGEIVFQIPLNNYCSQETPLDFSLQLSNATNIAADVTVHFYKANGSSSNLEGEAYREIQSNIVPGTAFSLQGYATKAYHMNFNTLKGCGDRVYVGKITVNSGQASLFARGWVNASGTVEHIVVNDNKQIDLAAPSAQVKLETAQP